MQLKGTRFGDIEVEDDKIITFIKPIIGFKEKKFVIITLEDYLPFRWLQSIDNPELAFIIIEPFYVRKNYNISLSLDQLKDLKIEDIQKDLFYAVLVSIRGPENISANLKAPILINSKKLLAKQIILDNSSYSVRENIEILQKVK